MAKEFLIELGTEELPPTLRRTLAEAFAANFEAEPAATQVAQPALVIATHSSVRNGTLQVAEWVPQATLVERDEITMPAFELGAEPIAKLTRDFVS